MKLEVFTSFYTTVQFLHFFLVRPILMMDFVQKIITKSKLQK